MAPSLPHAIRIRRTDSGSVVSAGGAAGSSRQQQQRQAPAGSLQGGQPLAGSRSHSLAPAASRHNQGRRGSLPLTSPSHSTNEEVRWLSSHGGAAQDERVGIEMQLAERAIRDEHRASPPRRGAADAGASRQPTFVQRPVGLRRGSSRTSVVEAMVARERRGSADATAGTSKAPTEPAQRPREAKRAAPVAAPNTLHALVEGEEFAGPSSHRHAEQPSSSSRSSAHVDDQEDDEPQDAEQSKEGADAKRTGPSAVQRWGSIASFGLWNGEKSQLSDEEKQQQQQRQADEAARQREQEHHDEEIVDYLDVVDPEISALGYLSNVQNSIFFPNIPAISRGTFSLPSVPKRRDGPGGSLARRRGSTASRSTMLTAPDELARAEEGEGNGRQSLRAPTLPDEDAAAAPQASDSDYSNSVHDADGRKIPQRDGSLAARRGSAMPTLLSRMSSTLSAAWPRKEEDPESEKHIAKWKEMDEDERNALDEHVRFLLTRRQKFRRGLKGFGKFVRTPMGFIMTTYGVLITGWGIMICLFIFRWINPPNRRYWIEICDQVLCALFAAVGLGFAPFRAIDTYRMIYIAHYHHLTWQRRRNLKLPTLEDPNDLPRPVANGANQVERVESHDVPHDDDASNSSKRPMVVRDNKFHTASRHTSEHDRTPLRVPESPQDGHNSATSLHSPGEESRDSGPKRPPMKRNTTIQSEIIKEEEDVVVLTPEEQSKLEHHQRKFHASHTYYRFHETSTHRAFPLDLMIVIVCLLDCHSLLQATLGGCTWGIYYLNRPTALTATLITCSLSCNAAAAIVMSVGTKRTKKREEVERRLRIALETEAFEIMQERQQMQEVSGTPAKPLRGVSTMPKANTAA